MTTPNLDKNMRIMEALSEVEQELLERSEKAIVAASDSEAKVDAAMENTTEKKAKIIFFVRKYGSMCAAVLLLAVVGSAVYGSGIFTRKGADEMVEEIAMDDMANTTAGGGNQAAPRAEMEGAAVAEEPMEAKAAEENGYEAADEEGTVYMTEELSDSMMEKETEEMYSCNGGNAISLQDAQAYVPDLAKYMPQTLPEGFTYQSSKLEVTEVAEIFTIHYVSGCCVLRWKAEGPLTKEQKMALDTGREANVCEAKDFTLEYVEEHLHDAEGISVLFPGDILINVLGAGTAEDTYNMFAPLLPLED